MTAANNTLIKPINSDQLTIPALPKLNWSDKALVGLAMLGNAYAIFNWYRLSIHGINPYIDGIFAAAAGISLDWGVMASATGNLRPGDKWYKGWAFWTPFIGFVSSSLITYNTYATDWWDSSAAVHMLIPLFVWAASQYVASSRRQATSDWVDQHTRQIINQLEQDKSTAQASVNTLTAKVDELTELVNKERNTNQRIIQEESIRTSAKIDALTIERDGLMERINALTEQVNTRINEPSFNQRSVNPKGKQAIRLILQDQPELINQPNEIIELMGINPEDDRAVRTARTQISQIKSEMGVS